MSLEAEFYRTLALLIEKADQADAKDALPIDIQEPPLDVITRKRLLDLFGKRYHYRVMGNGVIRVTELK